MQSACLSTFKSVLSIQGEVGWTEQIEIVETTYPENVVSFLKAPSVL